MWKKTAHLSLSNNCSFDSLSCKALQVAMAHSRWRTSRVLCGPDGTRPTQPTQLRRLCLVVFGWRDSTAVILKPRETLFMSKKTVLSSFYHLHIRLGKYTCLRFLHDQKIAVEYQKIIFGRPLEKHIETCCLKRPKKCIWTPESGRLWKS